MERESLEMDVVFVGAGPANLSGAYHLAHLIEEYRKQEAEGSQQETGKTIGEIQIAVIEKGSSVGAHILSGAVMDPCGLSELIPDFAAQGAPKPPSPPLPQAVRSSTTASNESFRINNLLRQNEEQGLSRQRTSWAVASIAAALYFSEGLPFGIVTELMPLYLRLHHVALTAIGSLSTVGLAWTLKVFWSPLVDTFGTYRRWIAAAVLTMMVVAVRFALMPETVGREFWILVTIFVIASATQDIAIDAFTIRITPKEMLGPVNSIRVTAYRIAIIAGGGGLAAVGGRFGWSSAFGTGAALFAIVLIVALWLPDDRGERAKRQSLFRDLAEWARRPTGSTAATRRRRSARSPPSSVSPSVWPECSLAARS